MHVLAEPVRSRAVEDGVGWYCYSEEDIDEEEWCCVKLKIWNAVSVPESSFIKSCVTVVNLWLFLDDWAFQEGPFHTHSGFDHLLSMNRIGSICIFIPAIRFESLELKWDVFYYKNLIDASWLEGDRLKVSFWLKVPGRKTQDLYLLLAVLWVISSRQTSKFPIMRLLIKINANEGGKKASKQTWMWVVKSPGWS